MKATIAGKIVELNVGLSLAMFVYHIGYRKSALEGNVEKPA